MSDERRESYMVVKRALERFEYVYQQRDTNFVLSLDLYTHNHLVEIELFKRSIRNTMINLTGRPQTKSIVMFGSKYDVFHTSNFCYTYPFVGIEVYRIELFVYVAYSSAGTCA